MSRSAHWEDVRDLVEESRRRCSEFDPATGDPTIPLERGVRPIVSLYAKIRGAGESLTDVERSLLSGALNDWLRLYAECHGYHHESSYTVHEVATAYARERDLETTLRRLLGVDAGAGSRSERQF